MSLNVKQLRTRIAHLLHRVPLPSLLHFRGSALLRLHDVRVEVRDGRRNRRGWLVEARRDLKLTLVYLLEALHLLVLRDLLEVLGGAVEQRNADVGLLQRTNVIRTVARHECRVAERSERREDVLLLRG